MSLLADPDVAQQRRRGLQASLTATVGANLPAFLTGSLAVQLQRDLHFGDAALGVAVGGFYAAGALTSTAAGRVVERLGAQRSLRLAALLSGVALLAIALLAHAYWVVLVLVALGGVANAWAQPASNVYLARIVPGHRLGLALGIQKSAIPAAAMIGGLAVPLAQQIGWRWAFAAGAAFAVASAWQVPREPPVATARRREGRPDVPTRSLVVLAVGVGLGASASNALSAFLVRGGLEAGLREGVAAVLLIVGSLLGIGVRLLFGARADRMPGHTLRFMVMLFGAASASFVLLAVERGWVFVLATPLAFATAYAWPGLFHLAVIRSNPTAPGSATGIAMTGTLAGAVAGPIVFGAVAEHAGFTAAWLVGAGMLVGACAIVALASRRIVEVPVTPSS